MSKYLLNIFAHHEAFLPYQKMIGHFFKNKYILLAKGDPVHTTQVQ